jgi:hypothetical protein
MELIDSLIRDTRHAVRGLRRSPGYALTAIALLALGLRFNAAVCTIAYLAGNVPIEF